MYRFESGKKSGLEHAFVVCFAVGALVLYAISGAEGTPYPVLFQAGSFVLLAAFVYLTVRYELKTYCYAVRDSGIRDEDGVPRLELVVIECGGKKETVVARVGLWQIDEVSVLDKKANKKKDFCQGKTAFVYDNRLFAPKRIGIRMSGTDPVVVIPYDEGMMGVIQGRVGTEN